MSWIAAAIIGGSLIGGVVSSNASRSAANTQRDAANKATDTQLSMFNTINDQQKPWREAGQSSLADIMKGFGDGGYFTHQFGAADLKSNLAPNYEFMRDQGIGATTNMANAMGGLGGNSLKAVNDYAQNYASNAYQQAFQNYNAQRTDIFNRLASIAGLGQTAGSAASTGAPAFASGISNTITGAGNAIAAGTVGQANAVTGGINNAMGWYQLNRIMNQPGASYGGGE